MTAVEWVWLLLATAGNGYLVVYLVRGGKLR